MHSPCQHLLCCVQLLSRTTKTKREFWRTHPARLSGPCKQARVERRWQARICKAAGTPR